MFWDTIGAEYISEEKELEKKLEREDVTLKEVLEDQNCFQEIRCGNEKLMAYLKREDILRELVNTVLSPPPPPSDLDISEPTGFNKEDYKLAHHCCEALCLAAKEFLDEIISHHPELKQKLVGFLAEQQGNLNHLLVSFYAKILVGFLSTEPEKMLSVLEESDFLENCLESMEFCAVFELLCTLVNCLPDAAFRNQVKKWYRKQNFAARLLDLLDHDQPSEIHENASATWIEFVKALREQRQNEDSPTADPLLDSLQSADIVSKLLERMFPKDAAAPDTLSPSLVLNGMAVVNCLVETNRWLNRPSWLLEQDAKGLLHSSIELITHNGCFVNFVEEQDTSPPYVSLEAQRKVEALSAERAPALISTLLFALDSPSKGGEHLGDVMCECWQGLINLVNTNFIDAHKEVLKALTADETSLSKLFGAFHAHLLCSVYATYLYTLLAYILYSCTRTSKQPLVELLVRDFNLSGRIMGALKELDGRKDGMKRLEVSAMRSFYFELANRLVKAQGDSAPNGHLICGLMKDLPDFADWEEFTRVQLKSYMEQSRSTQINNTSSSMATTRSSSQNIEIDELGNMPLGDMDEFRSHYPRTTVLPYASTDRPNAAAVDDEDEGLSTKSIFHSAIVPVKNGSVEGCCEQGEYAEDDEDDSLRTILTGTRDLRLFESGLLPDGGESGSPTKKLFEMLEEQKVSSMSDDEAANVEDGVKEEKTTEEDPREQEGAVKEANEPSKKD